MEKLTDTELKLIALKYAIKISSQDGGSVLEVAQEYYNWLKNNK